MMRFKQSRAFKDTRPDTRLLLLRGNYTRIQYRRTFFRGEGYRESDAVSAGIQDVDTHAPCWNQVRMCAQIKPIPSALCVFGAGTQYRFNEISVKSCTEISVKSCTGIQ